MTPALEAICAQLITPLAELMDEVRRTEAGLVFVPHADVAANQYPDAANRYLKQMMETCSFIQKLLEEIHKLAFVESRSAVASASANVSELLRAVSSLVHDYKSLASIRPSEQTNGSMNSC